MRLQNQGSCAIMATLLGNDLCIANIGDSRAVISSKGKTHTLTLDQKPQPCARNADQVGTIQRNMIVV